MQYALFQGNNPLLLIQIIKVTKRYFKLLKFILHLKDFRLNQSSSIRMYSVLVWNVVFEIT